MPQNSFNNPTPSRRLIGFFHRYWLLLLVFTGFALLALNDRVFQLVGTFAYAPALVTLAALCALLLRNIFNHETTDADADSGLFVDQWRALSPQQRFTFTFWQWIAYFLGACLIVAAIAK